MFGAYASLIALVGASALVGQAVFAVSGRSRWTPLAPAVGLAALLGVAWATARLPGEGAAALVALAVITLAAGVGLALRRPGRPQRPGLWVAVALAAAALGSLPFAVAGRIGILGTGLNPDMSQHLLGADRLAAGGTDRLISEGYPLGPHSLAVALGELGIGPVQAFDGLALAIAVATCLAALTACAALGPWRAALVALAAAFAYLLASNHIQGAFKESLEALFVLAFATFLAELAAGGRERGSAAWIRALPLAVIAIGAVYAYSFPGLLWLGATLGLWGAWELGLGFRAGGATRVRELARAAAPPAFGAAALVAIAIAPELGRIASFASFETFDPAGAGLGNLFDRLSPLEALGVWPSGDFRVEPGGGAVPAIAFYAGSLVAAAALAFGIVREVRDGRRALVAALGAAAVLWLYARVAGTPYQEAKALVVAAPLAVLIAVRGVLAAAPAPVAGLVGLAMAGSSALGLLNGPVGPSGYSPELVELRTDLGPGSTLVLAPAEVLDDEHGADFIGWELRGNRVCIEAAGVSDAVEPGIRRMITVGRNADGALVPTEITTVDGAGDGPGPCPAIADSARADPAGDD